MLGEKLGSYEIIEEIGHGGMATVYRAYQPNMDRTVAVKVISKTITDSDDAVLRFQREARLIARLEHLHILPVYDFDGAYDPPYIVMRYLEGGTLKDVMKQARLPLAEVAYVMRQVCSGIDYAHRQGIVHRDIKPSNIMIDREGNSFVTDFGIARMASDSGIDAKPITQTGATIGTPDYMAPEQGMGYDDIDQRADIYSLGVMLFEMLTEERPFTANSPMQIVIKHVQEPIPSIRHIKPDLPEALDELIFRALAKDRDERYQTVSEFSDAIMHALGGSIASTPTELRNAAEESQLLILRRRDGKHGEIQKTMAGFADARSKTDTDSQSTPTEQNKVVTALYANATEYAEIVDETVGVEAARRAVNTYWDAAEKIVKESSGQVFSRGENDLLALWGADVTHEDDAELAVHAALTMQQKLRELGAAFLEDESDDEPLPLNIGINTGAALLTPSDESSTYTASGATIRLVNRLAENAPGAILIGQDTFRAVQGVFTIDEETPLKVRGRTERLPVYRVLAARPRAFRVDIRGVQGIETQMVGRDAELKRLQDAMEDAFEEEETQVVTVLADAGLGKSRLLSEFEIWSDLHPVTFRIFQGRATSAMTSRPYALLRDIISFRFEILDSDAAEVVYAKMEAGVKDITQKDNTEMAHMIGHLVGFDFSESPHIKGMLGDPRHLIERAKQLFKRLFAQVAEIEPIIIQLEDIHHSDEASLTLLNELVEENDEIPMLMICLSRPTLLDRFPTWGAGQDFHRQIVLEPLEKRAGRALVKEILQKVEDVPKTLRDLIVDHAEGNPYYMEELVKILIEDRVIITGESEWTVEEAKLENLRVPPTLVGLLQTRLDTLLYPEKLTLQRAAVLGRIFYDSMLLKIDAADEVQLDNIPGILAKLVEREFIYERGSSSFEGHTEYIFAKTMMRDAIYDSLLRRQKRVYHTALAEWLIEAAGERKEEYIPLIAEHYELGEANEQAADYLRQAGERALILGENTEAKKFLEQALKLLPEDANKVRMQISMKLCAPLRTIGEYTLATKYGETAIKLARELGDKEALAQSLARLSSILQNTGEYVKAETLIKETLALGTDDRQTRFELFHSLSGLYWVTSRIAEGRSNSEKAVSLAREIGDDHIIARALNVMGILTSSDGDWEECRRCYEEALALYEKIGNRGGVAMVLGNLGELYRREEKNYEAAREVYQRSLDIAYELGELAAINIQELNLGLLALEMREVDTALLHGNRSMETALRIDAIPNILSCLLIYAGIFIMEDDTEKAVAWLGLAYTHPTSDDNVREDSELIFRMLHEKGLTDADIKAGMAKGENLNLDAVVAEIQALYLHKA